MRRRYSSSRKPSLPLHDADLVVHALDESQGDLVLRLAVGRDAVPVPVDHHGELLVGLQALPLE